MKRAVMIGIKGTMEIADVIPTTINIGSITVLLIVPEATISNEIITICWGCWGIRSAQWQGELDGPCVAGRDVSRSVWPLQS